MNDLNTISIDLTSKAGNDIVEKLLTAAAEPAALIGRAKNGSAVLIFRSRHPFQTIPHIVGASHYQRVFQLASKDGSVRITISTEAATPTAGYKFDSDIRHYQLPVAASTAADVGKRLVEAAFACGLTWAETVDRDLAQEARLAQWKADLAAGRVKIKTDEELQAERDAELVKENDGREVSQWDGHWAQQLIGARARHAARLAKVQAAADEIRQAEEDKKLLARVERGEFPHDAQRAIDARARQERRERQSAAA